MPKCVPKSSAFMLRLLFQAALPRYWICVIYLYDITISEYKETFIYFLIKRITTQLECVYNVSSDLIFLFHLLAWIFLIKEYKYISIYKP